MHSQLRIATATLVLAVATLGCSGTTPPTTTDASHPTATAPAAVATPEQIVAATAAIATPEQVAAATGFIQARAARNVAGALAYLDPSVFLGWGPGTTYDTLEAGMAWEDAFGIVSTPQACYALESSGELRSSSVSSSSRLRSRTPSATNPGSTASTSPSKGGLITSAVLGAQGPDCVYDYWNPTFVPFYAWMSTAHPESNPDAMYADRISPEGFARWTQYTQEFLADQPG